MTTADSTPQLNVHGSWRPATPLGVREEHGRFARLVLWLLRRPHCQRCTLSPTCEYGPHDRLAHPCSNGRPATRAEVGLAP